MRIAAPGVKPAHLVLPTLTCDMTCGSSINELTIFGRSIRKAHSIQADVPATIIRTTTVPTDLIRCLATTSGAITFARQAAIIATHLLALIALGDPWTFFLAFLNFRSTTGLCLGGGVFN